VKLSVSEAKGKLTDLMRRVREGEEVILTRHGRPEAKLVSVRPKHDAATKRRLMEEIMEEARGKATPGPDAAHSADYLYDEETGLPV
jgi:prevent-host-death family protein